MKFLFGIENTLWHSRTSPSSVASILHTLGLSPNNETCTARHCTSCCMLACRNYAVRVEHCFTGVQIKNLTTDGFLMCSLVTSWLCDETRVWRDDRVTSKLVALAYIAHNDFIQLIILRPHPHFTRHVRKKIRKTIRILHVWKSAGPQMRKSAFYRRPDVTSKRWSYLQYLDLSTRCIVKTQF